MYPWLAANAMKRARETTAHVGGREEGSLLLLLESMRRGSWKRKTSAELVSAESQERKERQLSQGPIVSVRFGSGRRKCVTTLNASERNSTILLSSAITGQFFMRKVSIVCADDKKGLGGRRTRSEWPDGRPEGNVAELGHHLVVVPKELVLRKGYLPAHALEKFPLVTSGSVLVVLEPNTFFLRGAHAHTKQGRPILAGAHKSKGAREER